MNSDSDFIQPTFNAHAHLELGALKGKIRPGLTFVDWLEKIVVLKRELTPQAISDAIRTGLEELYDNGTRALADISSLEHGRQAVREFCESHPDFRMIQFQEIIEIETHLANQAVQRAIGRQDEEPEEVRNLLQGISPHAPYTTTEELLRYANREARFRHQWLCIHAAETLEEREMLLYGRGSLYEFLVGVGVLPVEWEPPETTPIRWLDQCGVLTSRTLLVHCNVIDEGEIEIIRDRGCRVVVCPGTHVYFHRGAFPLERLMRAGVPVYLGTDSLASNESLDMRRELSLAMHLSPYVSISNLESLISVDRAKPFFIPLEGQKLS